MRTKILKSGTLLAVFLFALHTHGQVTIGSDKEPSAGALLDLKESGVTAKGLGLSRVKLDALDKLTMGTNVIADNPVGTWVYHTGLLVYHVSGVTPKHCAEIVDGLYVWDGNQWLPVGQNSEVKYYEDTRPQGLGSQSYAYNNFGFAGDWMLENLRYFDATITANPGSVVGSNAKYYAYPNGYETTPATAPATWSEVHGLLYSYSAATMGQWDGQNIENGNNPTEYTTAPTQGVCPSGWHVPTDYEWSQLEEELSKHPQKYSTVTVPTAWRDRLPTSVARGNKDDYEQTAWSPAGGDKIPGHDRAAKSACPPITSTWITGGQSFSIEQGGFNMIPVGASVGSDGYAYGVSSYFWAASTSESFNTPVAPIAWYRQLIVDRGGFFREATHRQYMFSVRCKKN